MGFTLLPFQAIECRLSGVTPVDEYWSAAAVKKFKQLILPSYAVTAQIVLVCQDSRLMVNIYIPGETGREEDVSETLIKLGLAAQEVVQEPSPVLKRVSLIPG